MNKVTLKNVIDIRTNQFYSVVIVSEKKVRFFVSAEASEQEASEE